MSLSAQFISYLNGKNKLLQETIRFFRPIFYITPTYIAVEISGSYF